MMSRNESTASAHDASIRPAEAEIERPPRPIPAVPPRTT